MSVEYPDIVGQEKCKDTFQVGTILKAACVDSLDTEGTEYLFPRTPHKLICCSLSVRNSECDRCQGS
jgi:hypothetical protein